jgi:chemotaxis methyl-accepting protein methylase
VADWHDPQFAPASFDLIHCRNSLRLSTKRYWRQSLARFRELLTPGGVLYVESVNAIGIQEEVGLLAAGPRRTLA